SNKWGAVHFRWLRGFFDFSDSFQFVFRLSIFFVTSTQRASSFGLRLFFFVLAFKLFIALPKAERGLPLRYQ
ncbi:MAG: hypothetical protein WA039_07175, partial [Gemmiger qucibialis]